MSLSYKVWPDYLFQWLHSACCSFFFFIIVLPVSKRTRAQSMCLITICPLKVVGGSQDLNLCLNSSLGLFVLHLSHLLLHTGQEVSRNSAESSRRTPGWTRPPCPVVWPKPPQDGSDLLPQPIRRGIPVTALAGSRLYSVLIRQVPYTY